MPACPDDDAIIAFIERRLTTGAVTAIEEHVDQCADCRRLMSELAHAFGEDETHTTGSLPPGPLLSAGVRVGRYVITGELGAGGMGVVYLARDTQLDRDVALKFVRGRAPGQAQNRLMREAKALAKLAHPNVVVAFDAGTYAHCVYVTMEYVEGLTLDAWLRAELRTLRERIDVLLQAGRGLAAAHAADIVHRDFKPSNVIVGFDGRVRVLDFGLASNEPTAAMSASSLGTDVTMTQEGAVIGTPRYMAPEQYAGKRAQAYSDQFAFALTVFRLLFDEPAFPGDSFEALKRNVLAGNKTTPKSDVVVSQRLHAAIDRALSIEPGDRFDALDDFLEVLEHAAIPPSRTARRGRWYAAAAATVALAAAVGFAWQPRASRVSAAMGRVVSVSVVSEPPQPALEPTAQAPASSPPVAVKPRPPVKADIDDPLADRH